MTRSSRQLRWVSAIEPRNQPLLLELQARMLEFYSRPGYYVTEALAQGESAWETDPQYRKILKHVRAAQSVLEVGCGRGRVLSHLSGAAVDYVGIDFSSEVIASNRRDFPQSHFEVIQDPRRFPVETASFDLVFSVYVLEHTVYPTAFLDECLRAVRPGGKIIIYCPNFLGRGWVSSQRVGFTAGGARGKLRTGAIWDGVISAIDRGLRVPWKCLCLRRQIGHGCGFFVNLNPVCFYDAFFPDADAIYLTYAPEIISYLGRMVRIESGSMVSNRTYRYYLEMTKAA